jgi:glycosyltransferase involved in cell wall biosynthesis
MPRPLKFCHFSIFYPPYSFGGDAIYLYRFVNALARRGHEVDVIHCLDSYRTFEKREPAGDFPNHPNVTVHSLRTRAGFLSPLIAQQTGLTWPKTDRILEVLLGKKFDVIHYHNISLFGPKVLELKPDYSDFIKLYTTHEHWLICPMHVLWKNNERLCEKPDCLRCTINFRRPPQWWRYTNLLDKCANSVDAFLSPSQFTLRMHHERGFLNEMQHFPHFVSRSELLRTTAGTGSQLRPYFLFVGRIEKIKGLQTLIPLFRNYPHADLVVAGSGTAEAELRQEAAGATNIVFLGTLGQERLEELYRGAIAVIVPSICYEVFGMIILEALMQRTPVIARAFGGLEEIVNESQGGFLYQKDEELLAAMESLRTNAPLRKEMGERGYRMCEARWSEEVHLQNYFRILDGTAIKKFGFVPWGAACQTPGKS